MPLTIRARIVDIRGAARANITVRANRFDVAGNAILLGSAATALDGRASIASPWGFTADYQPRVGLQITVGREAPVTLLAAPRSFANGICEFGDVLYDPEGEAAARDAPIRLAALEAEHAEVTATLRDQIMTLGAALEAAQVALRAAAVEAPAAVAGLAEPAPAPVEVSIQKLAQGTAEQLQATQAALAAQQGGFVLGSVSLELKVLPGATEGGVSLPGAREVGGIDAAALSTLKLDFHPKPTPSTAAGLTVPPLAGYTEALARRKLAERRLRAEVVAQLVADEREAGRVVLQSPAAGAAVAEGSTVVIAIGRKG